MNPAETVVQAQLDAYNARDMAAFLTPWAEDAEYYAFPATLLAHGKQAIADRHAERFKEPNLHGRLLSRTSVGGLVVDRELVTRTFPEGPGRVDVIAMYEVIDGRIAKAWFRMGTPVLDARAGRPCWTPGLTFRATSLQVDLQPR